MKTMPSEKKFFSGLVGLALISLSISCGRQAQHHQISTKVESTPGFRSCAQSDVTMDSWNSLGLGPLEQWLDQNSVLQTTPIDEQYQVQFAIEFAKIPNRLRSEVASQGGRVHLHQGRGVSDDPTWRLSLPQTSDGRQYSELPGVGGFPYLGQPTYIVANRLYDGHGSANLLIHEFTHSLDSTFSWGGMSGSRTWADLWRENPNFQVKMDQHCGSFCTAQPEEAFAETLAIYYSCEVNRQYIQSEFPAISNFVESLSNLDLRTLSI